MDERIKKEITVELIKKLGDKVKDCFIYEPRKQMVIFGNLPVAHLVYNESCDFLGGFFNFHDKSQIEKLPVKTVFDLIIKDIQY